MFERIKMKKTALNIEHIKLKAKLVSFAGYQMPIMYDKINNEYQAVRNSSAVFDVSHMGQIKITGDDAEKFIQKLTINNVENIKPFEAQYSAMCNLEGGFIDDLILFKFSTTEYIIIVNASNKSKVLDWINLHKSQFNINLYDMNNDYSLIALQGPQSRHILQKISSNKIDIKFYHLMNTKLLNQDVILSRTGYTGELGFEILAKHTSIIKIWNYLLQNNVSPAGLAVRDILRLEMKYCLYGNDIDDSTNPFEAGLSWILDLDKKEFLGKNRLLEIKSNKLTKKLCGFIMLEKAIPRKGYAIYSNDQKIGIVTSGNHSPKLSQGIGLGYINLGYHKIGDIISIEIRNKLVNAEIVKTPFINQTSLFD